LIGKCSPTRQVGFSEKRIFEICKDGWISDLLKWLRGRFVLIALGEYDAPILVLVESWDAARLTARDALPARAHR